MRLITGCCSPLSWLLSAILAVQPVVAFPCTCRASWDKPSKATRHDCCHGKTACRNSTKPSAVCRPVENRTCCCTGASSCACGCKSLAPTSPPATLARNAPADEFTMPPISVDHSAAEVVVGVHPAWNLDFLPACASALQRCIALCRWLI